MKQYTIRQRRYSYNGYRESDYTGTLPELVTKFSYTLLKGHSWENQRGNRKINTQPKTIRSLVSNLNNAENNAAANGFANVSYSLVSC